MEAVLLGGDTRLKIGALVVNLVQWLVVIIWFGLFKAGAWTCYESCFIDANIPLDYSLDYAVPSFALVIIGIAFLLTVILLQRYFEKTKLPFGVTKVVNLLVNFIVLVLLPLIIFSLAASDANNTATVATGTQYLCFDSICTYSCSFYSGNSPCNTNTIFNTMKGLVAFVAVLEAICFFFDIVLFVLWYRKYGNATQLNDTPTTGTVAEKDVEK